LDDNSVTAVYIDTSSYNSKMPYGSIKFYVKDRDEFEETKTSSYLGFPMLLGQ